MSPKCGYIGPLTIKLSVFTVDKLPPAFYTHVCNEAITSTGAVEVRVGGDDEAVVAVP